MSGEIEPVRQEGLLDCFPTCVWSIVRGRSHSWTRQEIVDMCGMDRLGCVLDISVQRLREAGIDAESITGGMDQILQLLEADQPAIVTIPSGSPRFNHCVVLIRASGDPVTVMDPARGALVALQRLLFERVWRAEGEEGYWLP